MCQQPDYVEGKWLPNLYTALTVDLDYVWHAELSGPRSRITGTQWTRIRSQSR
jgi:hypothetical protein